LTRIDRRWDTFSTGEMSVEKAVNPVFSTEPWNTRPRNQPANLEEPCLPNGERTNARTNEPTHQRAFSAVPHEINACVLPSGEG
jgi:hypothetical protein